MKRWIILLAAVAASNTAAQSPAKSGALRVVQAVPGLTSAVVSLDGRAFSGALGFKSTTDFAALPAGAHTLALRAPDAITPLLETRVLVRPGGFVTLALIGPPQSVKAVAFTASSLSPGAMQDPERPEKPEPAAEAAREENAEVKARSQQAKLSVYHLAPGVPRLDVLTAEGKKIASGLGYGRVGVNRVKPSNLRLRATSSGQGAPTLAALDGFKVIAGGSYSLFVFADGGRTTLVALENRVRR